MMATSLVKGAPISTNPRYPQPGFQNKQQQQHQPQQQYQVQNQQQDKKPIQQQQQQQQPPLPPQQQVQQNQAKPPPPQVVKAPPQPVKPQQQGAGLQQAAEKMLSDHAPENAVISTTSVDQIPGLGNGEDAEGAGAQKKPFWMKRNGRVNKAERAKRRNVRLRKLLQPKNALMVINELVGHVNFEISETKNNCEDVYKATTIVEGSEFSGLGKSKALAKSLAAESAVRSIVLKKLRITASAPPAPEEDNKDVKMEVAEENPEDVSWTHIASFAIHKLFSSWGEDGSDMISRSSSFASLPDIKDTSVLSGLQSQQEQKPAKKLPENAALMNPIMLLNQMQPLAKYEEVGKSGNPPNVQFTMKCTIDNQSFIGFGPNKKAARKQAAFEACRIVLGIQYPPDVLEGTADNKPAAAAMDTS